MDSLVVRMNKMRNDTKTSRPPNASVQIPHLLSRHLQITAVNLVDNIVRRLAIDRAPNALRGAKNLLHSPAKLLRKRLAPHRPRNLDDLVQGDVTTVLDVLLLFAVTGRLLERADDEGRGGGNDRDGRLTVLNGKLDGNTEALPRAGRLRNIFTDLFW